MNLVESVGLPITGVLHRACGDDQLEEKQRITV